MTAADAGDPAAAAGVDDRIATLTGAGVTSRSPCAGGDIATAWRVCLDDGRTVFCKRYGPGAAGAVSAEARGLAWLAAAGAVPVPTVLGSDDALLVIEWIERGVPGPAGPEALGRGLAALHAAGAETFGGPLPAVIAGLARDDRPTPTWPEFWAERRLLPLARRAIAAGGLRPGALPLAERLAARAPDLTGPGEPPARLHGDLWSGNVLWDASGTGWLIDPAAYGGHREVDLAMLALFPAAWTERAIAAYDEAAVLADGWRDRVTLNQIEPLLVHAALFGGGYGARAEAAMRRYAA